MRYLIFSDSHGRVDDMRKILKNQLSLDGIFHLGDGRREFLSLKSEFPNIPFFSACGNCDRETSSDFDIVELDGVKILYTHGHSQFVKHSIDPLLRLGKNNGVKVILYGHTHIQRLEYIDGIYLINPGSIGLDPYHPFASIDIKNGQILPAVASLNANRH